MQGMFLRDVMKLNLDSRNFRLFSPDENNSNRWQDVLDVTDRCYMAEILPDDDHLSPDGRVMEVLSEHRCQGWLRRCHRRGPRLPGQYAEVVMRPSRRGIRPGVIPRSHMGSGA